MSWIVCTLGANGKFVVVQYLDDIRRQMKPFWDDQIDAQEPQYLIYITVVVLDIAAVHGTGI